MQRHYANHLACLSDRSTCLGDCYCLSRFDKHPRRLYTSSGLPAVYSYPAHLYYQDNPLSPVFPVHAPTPPMCPGWPLNAQQLPSGIQYHAELLSCPYNIDFRLLYP